MIIKTTTKHRFLFTLLPMVAVLFSQPGVAADKSLLLLPLVIYSDQPKDYLRPGLKSMFVSRLSGEGLQLIGDEKLYPLLSEKEKEGVNSKERAEELGRALKADFAVFGGVTSMGGGYSLDLSVLDLGKEPPKETRISEAVPEDQLIPKLADMVYEIRAVIAGVDIRPQKREAEVEPKKKSIMGLFYPPGAEERELKPAGRVSAGMEPMGCDIGDLDGDGQAELVVLGRKKLQVFAIKEKLVLKDTLESSMGEEFVKVSVGDLNGDRKAEIYLVSSAGMRAESSVYEWTGKFRKILKVSGHLQVAKGADARPLLLSQDSLANSYFGDRISVMGFDGTKLVPKEVLPEFAEGAQFYTLTPLDTARKGTSGYVGLNSDSYLCLWGGSGNLLWRAEQKVGGTNNFIGPARPQSQEMINQIYFNARLLVTDLNQDGKKEVLVVENILMSQYTRIMKIVEKSNLVAYAVEPGRLAPIWKTPTFSYCITEMQTDGKKLFLTAQKGKMSNIGQGSGAIFWFE
jgi:FG-GAP-like repeat